MHYKGQVISFKLLCNSYVLGGKVGAQYFITFGCEVNRMLRARKAYRAFVRLDLGIRNGAISPKMPMPPFHPVFGIKGSNRAN